MQKEDNNIETCRPTLRTKTASGSGILEKEDNNNFETRRPIPRTKTSSGSGIFEKEDNNIFKTSRPTLRTKTSSGSGILETVKPRLKRKISTSNSILLNPSAAEFYPSYQQAMNRFLYLMNMKKMKYWRTVDGENIWVNDLVLIRQTKDGELFILN